MYEQEGVYETNVNGLCVRNELGLEIPAIALAARDYYLASVQMRQ